jgi:hypothetical protein
MYSRTPPLRRARVTTHSAATKFLNLLYGHYIYDLVRALQLHVVTIGGTGGLNHYYVPRYRPKGPRKCSLHFYVWAGVAGKHFQEV